MRTRESGFTIIELLVSISILAIITVPLTNVVIGIVRTTDGTTDRLSRSHDIQIATARFASDVESSDNVLTGTTPVTCGTSNAFVAFLWNDGTFAKQVTYSVATDGASGQTRLTRHYCTGTTLISTSVLSHFVKLAQAPPSCVVNGVTGACAATSKPSAVSVTITDSAGEAFTLSGTRRAL